MYNQFLLIFGIVCW